MTVEIELDIVSAAILERLSESKNAESVIVDFLAEEVKQTDIGSFCSEVKQTARA